MPSIFTIIGKAWEFYKKQPVLNQVVLLLFFPGMMLTLFENWMFSQPDAMSKSSSMIVITISVYIVFFLLQTFGHTCALVVGQRLLKSKAGRSRTSFSGVCKKAWPLLIPVIFTSILYNCFSVFWALLLIVPGVIYSTRAFFYDVIIVTERIEYRAALQKSISVVKGQTWTAFLYVFGLQVVIFIQPLLVYAIAGGLEAMSVREELVLIVNIIGDGVAAIAALIFALSQVVLYGELQKTATK